MKNTYLTFFQLILLDEKLNEAFNDFLRYMCFDEEGGLGPKHLRPLIDKERGPMTDQVECIFDYLQPETKRCINAEFCGYGKSYIDSFITVCSIKFFKIHNLKEKNGWRPLIILKTAPLTSLSSGNQLEKDVQYVFPLIKEGFVNIKLINNCSGSETTRMNEDEQNAILDTIIDDNNYPVKEHKRIKRMFSNIIEKIPDIDVESILNDKDLDVVIIYTCDKSLGKLNKFPDNTFDFASFDEAHVHFLNGGNVNNIEETNIFNSLEKFINKNPECVCRFFTATATYMKGCEKSTWNRRLFGPERIYLTYTRAIEIGRALPIYAWIFGCFVGNDGVSFDKFMRMKEENQVKYIANVVVCCNQWFHLIADTEKYSRSLIKTDGKYFKNLYKMYEKIEEFKTKRFAFNSDEVKKFFKDDVYYQYLVEGGVIVASTSGNGVIILTNDFNKNKKFNSVPELVNFLKNKKNADEYTNHDMLIFNIRQLATGHDINIFNNTIILCKCEADDFQQCIFRSGRLNGVKKKNVVFLVDSVVDNATIQAYCEVLDRLAAVLGAFDGHTSAEWKGDGWDIDENNPAWIYLKKKKMAILEKKCKCVDSNKLITAKTARDKFYNEWRVENDDNAEWDFEESLKSPEEYEDFKDKIFIMHHDEIQEKMIKGREYNI